MFSRQIRTGSGSVAMNPTRFCIALRTRVSSRATKSSQPGRYRFRFCIRVSSDEYPPPEPAPVKAKVLACGSTNTEPGATGSRVRYRLPASMREFPDEHIPMAYLVTFRAYGTWLHGDKRGSVDRFHNRFGTPRIAHNERWRKHNRSLLTGDLSRRRRWLCSRSARSKGLFGSGRHSGRRMSGRTSRGANSLDRDRKTS